MEEAPDHAILLITADSTEVLLPTIVSRCEVIRLRPMPVEDLEKSLSTKWQFPAEESGLLAHLSQGCPGTALNLHMHPDELQKRNELVHYALNMIHSPLWDRFAYAEK